MHLSLLPAVLRFIFSNFNANFMLKAFISLILKCLRKFPRFHKNSTTPTPNALLFQSIQLSDLCQIFNATKFIRTTDDKCIVSARDETYQSKK